jgi:hypothetical protein
MVPRTRAVVAKAPLTVRERLLGGGLLLGGLAWAGYLRAFDSSNWKMAVALNAWGGLVSLSALTAGLAAFRVPRGARAAAAIFGSIPWNTFLLSQFAYVGFFFIPLEVLAATLIVRSRAGLPRLWQAFVVVVSARAIAQVLIYAGRPAAHALFLGH